MNKREQKKLNEFLSQKKYILIDKKTGKPYSLSDRGFSNCLKYRPIGNHYKNVMVFNEPFDLKNFYICKEDKELQYIRYNPLKDEKGKERFEKARDKIVWKKLPRDKKIEINKNTRFNCVDVTLIDLYE